VFFVVALNRRETMNLEEEFDLAMKNIAESDRTRNVYPEYFAQMLKEHGGVEAAKRLMAAPKSQEGTDRLWEMGLLDRSVEAQVIKEKFHTLFTTMEIAEAHHRLTERDYEL
jgi:hypothetical protein